LLEVAKQSCQRRVKSLPTTASTSKSVKKRQILQVPRNKTKKTRVRQTTYSGVTSGAAKGTVG
jgi:hypothetical protein